MKNVFAIVVTWNGMRYDWVSKCLSSICESDIPVKTIVIDNASTDHTVEYIRQHFPDVILIASKENLGFGAANNLGFEKALTMGGEFFFLLNQDARVDKDCIGKLVVQSKKKPEYGILSPIHLNGKGDAMEAFFETTIGPNLCPGLYSDFVLNKVEDRIYKSGFINAAAWLLTKECLKRVGGFSPVFYHYGEDDNLFSRLVYKKMKIGVYPKTFIYHDKENSKTSPHDNETKYRQRMTTIDLAAPVREFDFAHYLRYFGKEYLKRMLKGNTKGAKEALKDLKHFKKERNIIERIRLESMSDKDYLFLNYND